MHKEEMFFRYKISQYCFLPLNYFINVNNLINIESLKEKYESIEKYACLSIKVAQLLIYHIISHILLHKS